MLIYPLPKQKPIVAHL